MHRKIFISILMGLVLLWGNISFAQQNTLKYNKEEFLHLIGKGDSLIRGGKFREALDVYKKAHSLAPDSAIANYKMGVAYLFLNKYDKALDAYKKAIDKDPNYYKAYNNMGYIYEKIGKISKAEESYKKAVKVKPDYLKAEYNLCRILYTQGKIEEALEVAKKLVKNHPKYAKGIYMYGAILETLDRFEEAREKYQKALELSVGFPEALEGIKRIDKKMKMEEKAKQKLEEARGIISFKLPPEYRFSKIVKDNQGIEGVVVEYAGKGKIFMIKLPDVHAKEDKSLTEFARSMPEKISDFLAGIGIKDVKFLSSSSFEYTSLGKKSNWEYVKIECTFNKEKTTGILTFVPLQADTQPIMVLALKQGKDFDISEIQKFLVNIGNSTTEDTEKQEGKENHS